MVGVKSGVKVRGSWSGRCKGWGQGRGGVKVSVKAGGQGRDQGWGSRWCGQGRVSRVSHDWWSQGRGQGRVVKFWSQGQGVSVRGRGSRSGGVWVKVWAVGVRWPVGFCVVGVGDK